VCNFIVGRSGCVGLPPLIQLVGRLPWTGANGWPHPTVEQGFTVADLAWGGSTAISYTRCVCVCVCEREREREKERKREREIEREREREREREGHLRDLYHRKRKFISFVSNAI
jgi:hypothetical protein